MRAPAPDPEACVRCGMARQLVSVLPSYVRSATLWLRIRAEPSGLPRSIACGTWKDGKLSDQSLAKLSIHAALQGIQAITSAADGTLLVGFEQKGPGAGLQRFADGQFQTLGLPGFDSENLDVTTLLQDRDNGFWVGTGDRGLYHIHGRTVDHIGPEDGLSGLSVQALMQDKEGNLWVATAGGLGQILAAAGRILWRPARPAR